MSGAAKPRKPTVLAKELVEPPQPSGTFENIPTIPTIAGDSREPRLKGKVVIVTGANSPLGIGRAASHLFAAQGAKALYITDYNSDHLETHKREINSLYPGCKVYTHQFDATEEDAVSAIVDEVLKTHGRLDVFFANAGIASASHYSDLSGEDFMFILKGNLLSAFLCAKYAAKAMLVTGPEKPYPKGSIVCTASVAGIRSNAGASDYSAAKAGVISLCQTMAYQLVGTGVRINAICPGLIETGMTSIVYEMARKKGTQGKIGQINPTRRGGIADEVARVAVFLGSDEASYVNGQAWAVDGGLSAGHPHVPGKLA